MNGILPNVRTENRRREFMSYFSTSFVAHVSPKLDIKIHPALETEAAAGQTGRSCNGQPARLNRQSTGSAQWIGERCLFSPAAQLNQCCCQGLVQRGFGLNRTVASFMERFPGAIPA